MGKKLPQKCAGYIYQWTEYETDYEIPQNLRRKGGNGPVASFLKGINNDLSSKNSKPAWLICARFFKGRWLVSAVLKLRLPTAAEKKIHSEEMDARKPVFESYVYVNEEESFLLALPKNEGYFDERLHHSLEKLRLSRNEMLQGANGLKIEIDDSDIARLKKNQKLSLADRLITLEANHVMPKIDTQYIHLQRVDSIDGQLLNLNETGHSGEKLFSEGVSQKEPQTTSVPGLENRDENADDLSRSAPANGQAEDNDYQSSDQAGEWSLAEIDLAVSDYFNMMAKESAGEPLNKAKHNAALRPQLNGRSKGSVEFKHQNISGVLSDLGLPSLRGYKPLSNYQLALRKRVIDFIATNSEMIEGIFLGYESSLPGKETLELFTKVDPPSFDTGNANGRLRQRLPRKLDFPALDEKNRSLGRKGEEWVCSYEQKRLRDLGLPELADQVDWTSDRIGDGTGYDIQSFNDDGSTRYIEVKTTNAGASTPFYVSQNEVDFSDEVGESFFIYRVFDFSTDPKFYELQGSLKVTTCLEATAYRARPMQKAEPAAD